MRAEELFREESGLMSSDAILQNAFLESIAVLDKLRKKDLNRWVVTYSGGKDSSLVTILATEYLRRVSDSEISMHVVYADTLLEIPPLWEIAKSFLTELNEIAANESLPVTTHHVEPKATERFWSKMIGKGYPPPKPRFRWCTHRLKIDPATPVISENNPCAVLTGVRYGESSSRSGRLKSACSTDGECGQDFWFVRANKDKNVAYVAPIVNWRSCRVWDFLAEYAPQWGWPTLDLVELYGFNKVRFGCWMCTMIKEDKALKLVTEGYEKWSHLKALGSFRDYVIEESKLEKNRVMRPDGRPGKLRLEFREGLLSRLRELEDDVQMELISKEELELIQNLWEEERDA